MTGHEPGGAAPDGAAPPPAEAGRLTDDARAVMDAAQATARAYARRFDTLRTLFAAEVGLARDALVQGLVFLLLAMVMVATAYGLLTALLVAGIRTLGAPWPLAIFVPLVLSLGLAWLLVKRAQTVLKLADFEGTRRQIKHHLGRDERAGGDTP